MADNEKSIVARRVVCIVTGSVRKGLKPAECRWVGYTLALLITLPAAVVSLGARHSHLEPSETHPPV